MKGLLTYSLGSLSVSGFVYEFQKDPIPKASSYWILGKVNIAQDEKSNMMQRPEVRFDVKTVIEDAKDAGALEEKMKGVSLGITQQYVMDNLKDDMFCCNGEDKEKGCTGKEFSLSTEKARSSHAISLDSASKVGSNNVLTPKPGQYYFWIANCGEGDAVELKIAGSVKVKSSHGYLPPEALTPNSIRFYLGIAFLVLCVVFTGYPFAGGFRKPCLLFAATCGLSCIRLMVAGPYAESQWNTSGDEGAGKTPNLIIGGFEVTIIFLLWESINSQGWNTTTTPSLTEHVILYVGALAVFTSFTLSNLYSNYHNQMRPPANFFKDAAEGKMATEISETSFFKTFFNFSSVQMSDFYVLGTTLVGFLPALMFAERHESANSETDFSKAVLIPVRRYGMFFFLGLIAFFLCSDYMNWKTPSNSEGLNQLEGVALDGALACIYMSIGYHFYAWESESGGSGKYGALSMSEIEMARNEEVENYDPDKLSEARVRLE